MKVCIIDPSLFTLPYDKHLCAGLHEAGVSVTLCGRPLRAGEAEMSEGFPFVPRCYPRSEGTVAKRTGRIFAWRKAIEHVSTSRRLAAWLERNFDVLHFQWSPMPLVDSWFWRRLARNRAVVFTVHDTTPFLGQATSRAQRWGWRGLLDAAHGLIVHTRRSRDALASMGVPGDRISIVPHGPLYHGATDQVLPACCVRDLDLPRTLLVFGEIKPYKGVDVLLRALAHVPRHVSREWRLVVAGRPRCDLAGLRALARKAGVAVEWRLGYVPDSEVPELFASASVVVFPYRQVDASGALMLALPFGLPVVATRVGMFSEMLDDGVDCLLADPGDERSLAVALERVMSDPALRARLGRSLRERADRMDDWSEIARDHIRIYNRIRDRWMMARREAGDSRALVDASAEGGPAVQATSIDH